MVRYGTNPRHGMARHGMVRHGMVWYGTAWHGTARRGTAWHGTAWHGMARHGMVWYGMARYGTARNGTARHGTAAAGMEWHLSIIHNSQPKGLAQISESVFVFENKNKTKEFYRKKNIKKFRKLRKLMKILKKGSRNRLMLMIFYRNLFSIFVIRHKLLGVIWEFLKR